MLRFTIRRLLLLVPILIGLSLLVFFWIRALPGGPAQALLGERATEARITAINKQYGLDKPVYVQYWRYVKKTVQGDLGARSSPRAPVTDELLERFPATIELALGAMFFAVMVGLPLGFFAAKRYGRAVRQCVARCLADRHLDPGLLPRHPAQVRLRRAARLVTHRGAAVGADRRVAPDELLHPRRAHHRQLPSFWDA